MQMEATKANSGKNPPEILGYAEPWIVAPGDTVAIKISCTEPKYKYRTVRLIQGIDLEHSPKKIEEEIIEIPRGQQQGRFQTSKLGSFGHVPNWGSPAAAGGLQVSFYVQPWLLDCPHPQTLISTLDSLVHTGFSITLNRRGSVDIKVGSGQDVKVLSTGLKPKKKAWSKIKVTFNGQSVLASMTHIAFHVEPIPSPATFEATLDIEPLVFVPGPLLIAASQIASANSNQSGPRPQAEDFFNGRIDRLSLKICGEKPLVLAKYDFSLEMSSDRIVDVSGRGRDGILVNAPTRAVKGHDWDGSEADWTRTKFGYGAIHFHEDDLDDAEWDTDFTITIPSTARSGVYAVEVESTNGLDTDSIIFFVRPTHWTSDNAKKVCLVFSTFTYLAYANEHLLESATDIGPGFDVNATLKSKEFYKIRRRADLGLSCYDRHSDGSGVCYSSSKRPIMNARPGYIMWAFSRPRELSADLFMVGYLEREGIPYEILTDHDLHARGASALQGFNTVITGCHPEYPTYQSYSAYGAYAKAGGNLMYLGGNGFYWVSALNSAIPHRIEVRRGDVGVRSFELPGGEHIHSLDGQRGGLWRSRGMSCNTLFGIGFCAQGTGMGVPYKLTEAGKDPALSWMLVGVSGDVIGEHGFGGGASGDEIDRFDVANGSPEGALTIATSVGHSDEFGIAIEDLDFPAVNTLGTQTNLIRSDIVYYVGAGGGAVFSVGSINWYCSLAWDGYDNNVARLTGNVIKGFLAGKR
ncbi:hypothetical protein SPI_09482 [Niveomyces insectorum RCEF 264]|uniref:N,N-dimethylformamidase beta subunit-like C-terminal domain-containing protein n=1 Tax=Niveomyces insectorum RCEF 264 TaxID=1081102 RepID=A0A162M9X5_9HYPO|nr:hypothetical protein SPI_09482 [Niveomyces insectorum RCEF 264]